MREKAILRASGSCYLDISTLKGGTYVMVLKENGKVFARNKIVVTE
jgi:hypothetical protein